MAEGNLLDGQVLSGKKEEQHTEVNNATCILCLGVLGKREEKEDKAMRIITKGNGEEKVMVKRVCNNNHYSTWE